ncbi:ATP-binding protein [Streptomyces boluensis]|uniref:ATP-binding protein n=1 Tax=Streptomyces boluensis TaxID=1775135 RepID=A0A964UPW5_9ACTN|nr:ATP-binding protein [Streptomyces boluensis]NBE53238.1 ATP-binding protein [Streptomyces boluensis]
MRAPRRTARVEYHLPRKPCSASGARQLTRMFLRRDGRRGHGPDDAGSALLVVSELVTNATRHGQGCCRLRLSVDARDQLVVEVHDSGRGHPRLRPHSPSAEGGRGIALVEALSSRLLVVPDGDGGKTVRAVLAGK